jgi:galactose mutarotase-like enzyme
MTEQLKISCGSTTATIVPSAGGLLAQVMVGQKNLFAPPFVQPTSFPGWPSGGCPILFPWAGRVWHKDVLGQFAWDGQIGEMPIHGNLYQTSTTVAAIGNDFVELQMPSFRLGNLKTSPEISMKIQYRIHHFQLQINLRLTGVSGSFPCAPGIHPFFALGNQKNWRCEIDAELEQDVTDRGLASLPMPTTTHRHDVYASKMQSRIFSELNTNTVSLANEAERIYVQSEPKADVVVVYRAPDSSFFCLEPWAALPNAVASQNGITLLHAGKTLDFQWTIGWKNLP